MLSCQENATEKGWVRVVNLGSPEIVSNFGRRTTPMPRLTISQTLKTCGKTASLGDNLATVWSVNPWTVPASAAVFKSRERNMLAISSHFCRNHDAGTQTLSKIKKS